MSLRAFFSVAGVDARDVGIPTYHSSSSSKVNPSYVRYYISRLYLTRIGELGLAPERWLVQP